MIGGEPEAGILRERLLWRRMAAIRARIHDRLCDLETAIATSPEPVPFAERGSLGLRPIRSGQSWGRAFACAWFRLRGSVPDVGPGSRPVLLVDIDGEGLVVDAEGRALSAITSVQTWVDRVQSTRGKTLVELPAGLHPGDAFELWIDAGFNGKFPPPFGRARFRHAFIASRREDICGYYYDFALLSFAVAALPRGGRERDLRAALERAWQAAGTYGADEVAAARAILAPFITGLGEVAASGTGAAEKAGQSGGVGAAEARVAENREGRLVARFPDTTLPEFTAIGHSHLDLAWLWPLRETHRKAARTFVTALGNLDRYPDYIYGASQPQQFAWIKEERPELWERLRVAVATGRLELQGGMWVEADANLPSGESLVRQLLYGTRFFREEFGRQMRVCWLPDVFGYPASLPQILRLAGIEYFLTIKLSWNDRTVFPHRSFRWIGIDGSEVLVHMPPEGDYNSGATPLCMRQAVRRYPEKDLAPMALVLYGAGDGGGGPGEAHIEFMGRQSSLAGLPGVRPGRAVDFFDTLAGFRDRLPEWRGELYLEKHQGTFTTQARSKLANRRMETALHGLEHAASLAWMEGGEYPRAFLERAWKEVLLYQFHDILPGSGIGRVYDESLARYAILLREVEAERLRLLSGLRRGRESGRRQRRGADSGDLPGRDADGYGDEYSDKSSRPVAPASSPSPTLVNSAPFSREVHAKVRGRWLSASLPAYGAAPLVEASGPFPVAIGSSPTGDFLENDRLRATFSPKGHLVSLLDRRRGVESCGSYLNRLVVYLDPWRYFNAWDILDGWWRLPRKVLHALSVETIVDGPRVIRRSRYRHGRTELEQDAILVAGSPILEFETRCEWQETFRMLRADFNPAVRAGTVRCDIQFGSFERSTLETTKAERAQFEICAHQWVDLSDGKEGLALLNDSKYGHRAKGGFLSLNLLRSPVYPDPKADRGAQAFRYALMPHGGDAFEGGVVREAVLFNQPPLAMDDGPSSLPRFQVEPENVILDTIKVTEDGSSLALRFYESHGRACEADIKLPEGWELRREVDLLERPLGGVQIGGGPRSGTGFGRSGAALALALAMTPTPAPGRLDAAKVPFGAFEIKTFLVTRIG